MAEPTPVSSDESASLLHTFIWSTTGMNVLAGTISGAIGVITGHPFDTIKVRLQAQPHGKNATLLYRSTLHCLLSTVRAEGLLGLFKGVSSPLVGVTAINTLLFGVYGFLLESLAPAGTSPTLNHILVAGAGSGLINSFISGPVELAKIQMQNQIGHENFRSPSECLKRVWKSGGVRACYKGLWPTILRETPSYGVYFASFEGFRRLWTTEDNQGHLGNASLMLAGGLSGIVAWMSTYPIDVIKTRIQALPINAAGGGQNLSILHSLRDILKTEGYPGLFRGTTATILRAFPTNAVIFSTYALSMRWLESVKPARRKNMSDDS